MPRLVIIRGNSGSGKSTLAKAVQKQLKQSDNNVLLIQQDVVRRDMLNIADGGKGDTQRLIAHLLDYGKAHCDYVILEGILKCQRYKELFESALDSYDNQVYAYYYDIPFEETLKRHQTKPNRAEFGEKEMRSWWNEKDYIGIPEINEKIFDENISVQNAVQTILRDIEQL